VLAQRCLWLVRRPELGQQCDAVEGVEQDGSYLEEGRLRGLGGAAFVWAVG
jgi:hypothetical protein